MAVSSPVTDRVGTAAPTLTLRVGLSGPDLLAALRRQGERWDVQELAWAATGNAAASVLVPFLSQVSGLEVYIDAPTPAELWAVAERSQLPPMEGGRVLLRPFPTPVTRRMRSQVDGLLVAPWPRVFADLRTTGVRGEEAAEHLREVLDQDG